MASKYDNNPIMRLVASQLVGVEEADAIELPALLWFTAARLNRCNAHGYNMIVRHLIMAYYVAVRLNSPSFKLIATLAGDAWRKAGQRPGHDMGLTTKEYRQVRAALGVYFRHLPKMQIGLFAEAAEAVDIILSQQP